VTQLTQSTTVQSRQPAWSPDGNQIVYTVYRNGLLQVWLMNADGSNSSQLVRSGGGFSDYLPTFSPDGTYILFSQGKKDAVTLASLLKFSLDTAQAETVISNTVIAVVDVDLSPDGVWTVYESSDGKSQNIRLYNLQDGTTHPLTTSNAIEYDPAWRPGK
jgi:TolB protein